MKHFIFAIICMLLFTGCVKCMTGRCADCCAEKYVKELNDSIKTARQKILDGKAGCVIIKNGKIILDIYRQHPDKMKDSLLVDKVIGKAAAMVAICGKVKFVHAELICDSAVEILEKHNIKVTYTKRVRDILNRRRDGLCPMEKTVLHISDPASGVTALEAAVAKMKR